MSRKLGPGDWVEVRSKEEILQKLDGNGQLDGMPFMPEMFKFCGKTFQVYKRAHKTCDTVFPVRGRRVHRAVHLATRCDGQAHGGCQAGCLIFWKEAWLKRVTRDASNGFAKSDAPFNSAPDMKSIGCTESDVWAAAQKCELQSQVPTYMCQATQLPYATTRLEWWDIRQYVEDYQSRNVSLRRIFSGLVYSIYFNLSQAGIGVGPAMRWFYNSVRWLWRGSKFPRSQGTILAGEPTPNATLNLQVGELVRVKPHEEILRSLDTDNRNRGLAFDAEMVPYCGGAYRVLKRVARIIDERTGRMLEMKAPCIILDGVFCQSRYSGCRMFCPRSIYSYWREVWLERVEAGLAYSMETKSETSGRTRQASSR